MERLKAVDDAERLNAQYGFYVDKSYAGRDFSAFH